ncbi:MAG: hypothetical protein WAK08_26905 [Pseudolabrys sp.]|jgi:hypothetical protein
MADKPTKPAPAGGGRRKRPTPTIDLTATEVPAKPDEPKMDTRGQAGRPSQEQSAEAPSEAARESCPARGYDGSSQRGDLWQTLVAGCAGAALTTGALFALWFGGLVPARNGETVRTDFPLTAALNDRIARIEAAVARPQGADPSVSERLSAADNAMKSLGIALTALTRRSDENAAGAAEARARADAAEKAVAQLRAGMQNISKNTGGLSPAEVDSVQKRITALEEVAKAIPTDSPARLALSAAALRDAVMSGAPFVAELAEAKSLGADEKALAPLTLFAQTGVPTNAALAQELRALIPALLKSSGAQAPTGFLDRLEANAGKLVRIRPVGAPTGDDASAVLARVEIEVAHAAIDDALTDLGKLEPAVRAPAQDWIRKAQSGQAAFAAARQFASETTHALGKR